MTPFKRLVQLIEENKISVVPIVDAQGRPVGTVSESDLLFKADGAVAYEIMTKPPITVRSDTTLPQAARRMQEHNIRRLVVVDERGKIVGVVSRSDLLQVV
jgi:CBS domain-containing protein